MVASSRQVKVRVDVADEQFIVRKLKSIVRKLWSILRKLRFIQCRRVQYQFQEQVRPVGHTRRK